MAQTALALDNMTRALIKLANYQNMMETYENQPFYSREDWVDDADTVDCNPDDDHVSSDDQGTGWYRFDIIGICLSLASLSFVSYAILSDKRVRGHPNNIIAYICLCDAYTYCQYLNRYIICGYGLNLGLERLFSWTFLYPYWAIKVKWLGIEHINSSGSKMTWDYLEDYYDLHGYWYGAVSTRLQMWYFLSITISYCSLFFSLAAILDLYQVLRNPF